jgi:hypothetical protein
LVYETYKRSAINETVLPVCFSAVLFWFAGVAVFMKGLQRRYDMPVAPCGM